MPITLPDGHSLNVETRGEGPPLLLVHGFPLNHTMWSDQLADLASDFRLVAPDLRGFGQSGVVTDESITMDRFADDLNDLLDALDIDEPVIYCGLSMGGYIGFRFVEKYADRLRGLILCDTRPEADSEQAVRNRHGLAKKVLRAGTETAIEAMLPKLVSDKTNAENPGVVERLQTMIANTPRESIAAALCGMAERPDSTPLLSQIKVPTLVICGEEDILTPPDVMRAMADRIPASRYVEIPQAGHMAPMEDPIAVNAAIREFAL